MPSTCMHAGITCIAWFVYTFVLCVCVCVCVCMWHVWSVDVCDISLDCVCLAN